MGNSAIEREVNLSGGRFELAPGEPRIRVAAVGDLMLGGGVGDTIREHGPGYPFDFVKPLLSDRDILFANLEWPLTATSRRHPAIRHRARFAPTDAVKSIDDVGFTVLSVANNHIFDCVEEGLAETLWLLRQHGIAWVGAGASMKAARTPAIQVSNGVRVGFLAYTFPLLQIATEELPGCAPSFPTLMLEDVRRLRAHVDHVIVSMHTGPDGGSEFLFYPSLTRQGICRMLIDQGVTAVLCHHCHVPQGIEIYKNCLIAHCLGSFAVDIHDWFFQSAEPPYTDYVDKGMILHLDLDQRRLLGFRVHPTFTGRDLAVRPLEGTGREDFLRFLQEVSEPLYDAESLERVLPGRTVRAKLQRLALKARRHGLRGLGAELYSDIVDLIDGHVFEPRRIRSWERERRAGPRRFGPTGIPFP